MTIEVKAFEGLPKLMADLEALALSDQDFVFRGHQDEAWKIASTLARYTPTPHRGWDTHIDEMLSHFIVNALSIGPIPFPPADRRSRLEYGRHYGVPTPVIDFSWFPYVALYFAFSGIQYRRESAPKNAAIYALDISSLGLCWGRLWNADPVKEYNEFIQENTRMFDHGYPAGRLKFMRHPASWNTRMQRQLGCFIYDTLDYSGRGVGHGDFEGLIGSLDEPPFSDRQKPPTLTKFIVPHSEAGRVFSRLELMNINATKLIDVEGLASDVKNSYNYSRKTGYAWDIELAPPDDTKM